MTFACRYLEVKILLRKTTMLNLIFLLVPLNSAIIFNESQMSQSVDWEISTSVEQKTKLEKYSRCGSDLNILDCDSPKQFSISEVNEIQSQYKTGNKCITTRLSSNWILIYENGTVQNLQHFQNEETLVIEPFSLGKGSYQALLYVEEYNENGIKDFLSKQCFFEIRPEQSIPVKEDGEKVSMNTDEEFILDSRDSIDPNVPPNHTETSHYEWRCKTSRRNRPDSCRQNLGSATSTIPDEYAVEGLIYNFRLSVGNKNSARRKTSQIVEPRGRGGMLFNMHFLENCRPICDVEKKIVFEAMCEANCERMNENATFFWTVDILDFDYKTNTSGREGKQFTIKADVLEPDKKYKVGYKLKGDPSDGVFVDLLTHKGPKLRYCQLNPDIGTALVTDFHVICGQEPGSYTYKIYLVSDDVEFLLTTGTSLYDMPFHLNENSDIRIEIIDEYHFTDSVTVFAEVIKLPGQSQPDGKPNTEYIEGKYFNAAQNLSVFNLLSSNRIHQLLQTLNMLTDELPNLPNVTLNVLKEYHLKTLDILRKLPLDNKEVAKQVAAVTSKIAKQYESKSDPWTSEAITDVCQFGSNKYLGHVKDEKYVGMIADDIEKAVRMFSGCSRALEGENPEILQVQGTFVETTTPFVLVDFPVITEDYPDYVDDQNISKMLTKYDTACRNIVNQCYVNARTLALSMVNREDTKVIANGNFEIAATREMGLDIPYVLISSQGVELLASEDFVEYEKKDVDVLLCTVSKNLFWWSQKEKIPTALAMLLFSVEEEVITKFVKPFLISFKNIENKTAATVLHTSRTPSQTNSTLPLDIYAFERITMFRIDVFRKQGYIIEFEELALNESLNVYVSDFVKPTPKEFRDKAKLVTHNHNTLYIPHELDYDGWHYLCVLPGISDQQDQEFKFRVYTMSCYHWEPSIRNWEFSCGSDSSTTFERFDCLCYHSSVLSGKIKNNDLREEKSTYTMHELELETNFIIFISVAVAFSLYCVLLIYITLSSRKISEKSIYFLSDIPSSHRFGYLLIVKTGNKSGAGTTSNIVIKLYGKNSESKEHVLNFPDPEKRILQHNQGDWFFLATKLHLGEIEKLEIWFDSLGLRPSWYCSEIEVVDLQMNKYWWFNINYRFEIGDKENHFLTAVPESPPYVKKKRRISFRKFSLHGCHMWNIFHDDEVTISRTKRLTIMLSIFMTTYTIILFLYGCPKLQNSDSVGQYSEYGFHMHLLWTTLGGFAITFLIHMPIVYFFRFYQEEKSGEKVGLLGKYSFQINLFCWGLVIFLVIACMTTLLILGYWVPHVTALLWLTSTVVSLLIYIFLLENLVTIVYNFILRRTKRLVHILRRIKPIMASIEAQRAYIYRKFSENSLRSYYRHLYKPLDPARIKEQKHWAHIKESTFEIVEDLIMITIYVLLLYTVILKDKDPMTFLSNREAHDLIIGIHSRTIPKGHALFDRKEIQEYITNTLVFSMQSPQWYGKYVIKDPGMTIDNNNKYIGIARLRQLRSTNVSCVVVSPMEFVTQECIHEFSEGPEYEDFSETWGHDENSDEFSRMDQVWNYNAYTVTGSFSYVGKFATYPGGGYVATLGRTMKNSLTNLNYIFRNKWIDRFTRCLFIEFLLYNSNSNLFQSIVIKFEISTSGLIRTKFNVNSARLLFVKEKTGLLLTILLFCFVLMIIILSVKLVLKLVRKKKKIVFKDLWHIVDIIIIMISMACLFLYMERTILVKRFLERIEKAKHNEFVNYFHLFFAETALTSLAAFLVFIATLRLWKLLKFLLIIKIAEKTLTSSLGPIASIFLYHMLTIFIFTLVGMVFFGDQSNDFKDLLDSAVTLLLMSLSFHQDFDFSSLKTPLHQSYYSFYMLISLFFLTLYVAIITISYAEAQVFYSKGQGYDVFDYLKEQYQYYKEVAGVKLRNSRIRGGEEDGSEVRKWVFPKADVHRYANCLTLPKNKTNAMVYVTLAILRSMKRNQKLTADDENLIKLMIVNLFREDSEENDFFFISHAKPGKATLVDDLVFLKMEKVLTVLFSNRGKHKEQLYDKLLENTEKKLEKMSYNLSVLMNSLDRIDFRVED
nr:uncharacterized protein LOC111518254 isoform X2 [Leptinotarsa decemlineata]